MVIFVAVAVGFVGQFVGLSLGAALLIGAAVGPTDATAVSSLGKGISKGQMVVLRAESLINDGTALVVFALALEYAGEQQQITLSHALVTFLISFGGGAAIGFAGGWLIARLGAPIENPHDWKSLPPSRPFPDLFLGRNGGGIRCTGGSGLRALHDASWTKISKYRFTICGTPLLGGGHLYPQLLALLLDGLRSARDCQKP